WLHVRDPKVYERDWGRMLRSAGYLPTWLIVAIALWGQDRHRTGWGWRGGLMILTPTASGALAELSKLVVRRLRPPDITAQFTYAFRPFAERPWSTGGLGMPSSHMLVAMGAATVLARLFPRVWWLWYLIAAGCGYTRLLANAHYLSDVVAAAFIGWVVGDLAVRFAAKKVVG
ncbi:MAG: phosphatase PAP2 family protein, partial [Gemmatimonadaceae bacterium]